MNGTTTPKRLALDTLRDLAVDIRCARRDGLPGYAEDCRREFRRVWALRHTARIGTHGGIR